MEIDVYLSAFGLSLFYIEAAHRDLYLMWENSKRRILMEWLNKILIFNFDTQGEIWKRFSQRIAHICSFITITKYTQGNCWNKKVEAYIS